MSTRLLKFVGEGIYWWLFFATAGAAIAAWVR